MSNNLPAIVFDALRRKLIADLSDLAIWKTGHERLVTPPWHVLTVAERDVLVKALKQWRPA